MLTWQVIADRDVASYDIFANPAYAVTSVALMDARELVELAGLPLRDSKGRMTKQLSPTVSRASSRIHPDPGPVSPDLSTESWQPSYDAGLDGALSPGMVNGDTWEYGQVEAMEAGQAGPVSLAWQGGEDGAWGVEETEAAGGEGVEETGEGQGVGPLPTDETNGLDTVGQDARGNSEMDADELLRVLEELEGDEVGAEGDADVPAIDGISTDWLEGCGSDHGVVPDIGDTEATLASRDAEEPAVEMESGGDVATMGIGEWPGVADAGPVLVGEDGGEWREWPSAQLDPQAPTDTVDYDGSSGQSQRLSPSAFT